MMRGGRWQWIGLAALCVAAAAVPQQPPDAEPQWMGALSQARTLGEALPAVLAGFSELMEMNARLVEMNGELRRRVEVLEGREAPTGVVSHRKSAASHGCCLVVPCDCCHRLWFCCGRALPIAPVLPHPPARCA